MNARALIRAVAAVRQQFDALVGRSRAVASECSLSTLQDVADDARASLASRYAARALLALYVARSSPATFEDDPLYWRRRAYSLVLRALALIRRVGTAVVALFGAINTQRITPTQPLASERARDYVHSLAPPLVVASAVPLRC